MWVPSGRTGRPAIERASSASRRHAPQALALLFAVGGAFAAVALVLPHPPGSHTGVIAAVSAAAFAAAGALVVLDPRLVPLGLCNAGIGLGTVLISVAIWAWTPGEIASAVALLYVWVLLYAYYFFKLRVAIAHNVVVALAYAMTLRLQDGHRAAETQWIVTVGTATVAGCLIGWLVHRIHDVARTDPLTGVANRRAWEEAATAELARSRRSGSPLAVAICDVDCFKEVNDGGGHHAGDLLLENLAAAWTERMRQGDLLGRWGGDEFVVLLAGCTAAEAMEAAERLVSPLTGVTSTIGVAGWDGVEDVRSLVERADHALYAGKRTGGRCALLAP